MDLGLNDFKRFEKQIVLKNIGVRGQKKILNSKVLIIGIGGLGCPLLTYLSASGVGTVGIADPDKVEISNLNRQTLFTIDDIGKYKVNQAKINIKKTNNKIKIKIFRKRITSINIKTIIKDFDIICDGTDNFETRYLINDECKVARDRRYRIIKIYKKINRHNLLQLWDIDTTNQKTENNSYRKCIDDIIKVC